MRKCNTVFLAVLHSRIVCFYAIIQISRKGVAGIADMYPTLRKRQSSTNSAKVYCSKQKIIVNIFRSDLQNSMIFQC